jgi:hypothetical protein
VDELDDINIHADDKKKNGRKKIAHQLIAVFKIEV